MIDEKRVENIRTYGVHHNTGPRGPEFSLKIWAWPRTEKRRMSS